MSSRPCQRESGPRVSARDGELINRYAAPSCFFSRALVLEGPSSILSSVIQLHLRRVHLRQHALAIPWNLSSRPVSRMYQPLILL